MEKQDWSCVRCEHPTHGNGEPSPGFPVLTKESEACHGNSIWTSNFGSFCGSFLRATCFLLTLFHSRDRQREKQALCRRPMWDSIPDPGIMTWAKGRRSTAEPLRYPGPLSYSIHKNKLKMDETPKCETETHQNCRGEQRQQPLWPRPQQLLTRHVARSKGNKSKKELFDLHQDKKQRKNKKQKTKQNKNKTFAQQRKESTKLKANLRNGRGICKYLFFFLSANILWDKGIVSKIYKDPIQLNTQKTKKIHEEMGGRNEQHFSKWDIQKWSADIWKNAQHHLASGKSKSKAKWDIIYTSQNS